MNRWSQRHTRY